MRVVMLFMNLVHLTLFAISEFEEFTEHEEFIEFYKEPLEEEVVLVEPIDFTGIPDGIGIFFQENVPFGSTVIDFGETKMTSMVLSKLVGPFGKVLCFDQKTNFEQIANIEPYWVNLESIDVDLLEHLDVENLSLIKVDAWGHEDQVLKMATSIIASQKPMLLINMLGGISVEKTDRYVKDEFDMRIDQIKRMGYNIQRINDTFYLAKAKDKN